MSRASVDLGRVLPVGRERGELGDRAGEQVVAGEELDAAPQQHAEVLVGRRRPRAAVSSVPRRISSRIVALSCSARGPRRAAVPVAELPRPQRREALVGAAEVGLVVDDLPPEAVDRRTEGVEHGDLVAVDRRAADVARPRHAQRPVGRIEPGAAG